MSATPADHYDFSRSIAMQTAVALADFENDRDDEDHILLKDTHIMQVVQMSKQFRDYLNKLHQGDEGKRAERERLRYDHFDKNSSKRDERDSTNGYPRGGDSYRPRR